MKNRNIYLFSTLTLMIFFLSGCSSIPFQKAKSYISQLYRRIPYIVEGNYRVADIFYVSSREVKGKKDSPKSYLPKLGKGVTSGILSVKIDPSIKIGKVLPARLKRKGKVEIQKIQNLQEDVFMKELADAVNASPHNSLMVLVFGYKDSFELTAIKAAYFMYLLDINTPILLFDWPGDQSVSPWGYKKAQRLAKESGPYLGGELIKIIREIKPEKLWIEASSLGCQVVCNSFEYMVKHKDFYDADTEIDHVVLAAPDVGAEEFDLQFKNEIIVLSESLTAYVSSNDEALLISALIDQEKKLGRRTLKETKHEQLEEMKDLLYLQSLHPGKINLVDVTPINNASYNHGYYMEAPEFYDDFYMRILNKDQNANRRLYLIKYKKDTDYWILRSH